jgi:hypothetical protein
VVLNNHGRALICFICDFFRLTSKRREVNKRRKRRGRREQGGEKRSRRGIQQKTKTK